MPTHCDGDEKAVRRDHLMHDAGGTRTQTLAALPAIIRHLRAKHYRLVTVPRLMRDDPPSKKQPLPTGNAG